MIIFFLALLMMIVMSTSAMILFVQENDTQSNPEKHKTKPVHNLRMSSKNKTIG